MSSQLLPPETPEQRKARQFATLHTLGDLGTDLAIDAHAQAKKQLAAPAHARPKDAPDYAATFASMSRSVRQSIAIEIRLDAPARTRPTFRPSRLADPRRELLRRAFHDAARGDPERRREIDPAIDRLLEADPDQQTPIEDTLASLCNGLGIYLDVARIPDALLNFGLPPRPPRPPSHAGP